MSSALALLPLLKLTDPLPVPLFEVPPYATGLNPVLPLLLLVLLLELDPLLELELDP